MKPIIEKSISSMQDSGNVRIGGRSPAFRIVEKPAQVHTTEKEQQVTSRTTNDRGAVRIGGRSPAFRVSSVPQMMNDRNKVRIGGRSPAFKI